MIVAYFLNLDSAAYCLQTRFTIITMKDEVIAIHAILIM